MATTAQTTTAPPNIDITAEYLRLIEGAGRLLNYAIQSLQQRNKSGTDDLQISADLTIANLVSVQAQTAVSYAASRLDPVSVAALGYELRYINANLPSDHTYLLTDEANLDAAEDAKTGKDSLEDLLGKWLPKWLKNLLKVLNELLSIAFKA